MFRAGTSECYGLETMAADAREAPAWQEPIGSPAVVVADQLDVVIRSDDSVGVEKRCSVCSASFAGGGPTAFAGQRPLCDRCVFDHDAQLAMVLAAISVLRAFGEAAPSEADRQAALDLLRFARLYESFADRHGPRREPQLPAPSA